MAVLPEPDRDRTWRAFMRRNLDACGFNKTQLRAAVDATDDWIDSNAASYNSALPVAFRTSATATQKTLLFVLVAMRRQGLLRVDEDS